MFRYKFILTAAVLAAFVFIGFVNSGNADFEIVEMTTDSEDTNYGDSSQGIWHMAHVKTSAPYYAVDWFIDGEYQMSSFGDGINPKFDAYFWPYWLTGYLTGREYTIKAVAYPLNDENPIGGTQVTSSYTLKIYQGVKTSGNGNFSGVYGSAEIHSQYFDGNAFQISGSASAYNGTQNEDIQVLSWFRQQEWTGVNGNFLFEHRDTKDIESLAPGASYYTYPDSEKTKFVHFEGRRMREGEERFFNAHTHLQVFNNGNGPVRVDDWEADTAQQTGTTAVKFTWKDNPPE